MATRAIDIRDARTGDRLFVEIGAFLAAHRLSPDPDNYAFAHRVVSNPDGAIARRVLELCDGGVRLSAQDIQRLGGIVTVGAPVDGATIDAPPVEEAPVAEAPAPETPVSEALIERMLEQIDTFSDTMRTAHVEANDFGRDLARSADSMRSAGPEAGIEEITRLTDAMIERVRRAEIKLENARRESQDLRTALDEARGSARTDPLTDLPNRRAFDETFAALEGDAPVVVAICDIDHFKIVNDSFGHAVGDRVIRTVAQALASECGGMVARYGGEEFALLFQGVPLDAAATLIDRVRAGVAARRMRVRETGEPIGTVSFSAGVAEGRAGEGRAALMARADAALYRAKDQGRARTVSTP